LKILVVDDNPVNLKLMQYVLQDFHEIHLAGNGAEAVFKATRFLYDLIIMDLCMPLMDGAEATLTIRRSTDNSNCNTPIIIYSTSCLEHDRRRCLKYGANEYLIKSVHVENLKEKVEHFSRVKKMKFSI